jgi:glycerate kinase
MKGVTSLEEALMKGQENLEKTAENIIRLFNLL